MSPTRAALIVPALTAALVLALPVTSAYSAVQGRAENAAHPKAWPAVAGLSAAQVVTLAASVPAGSTDPDLPWCDADQKIESALTAEFGEKPVAAARDGLQLWGSGTEGTWTMVLPRADDTSCVVVSGIGFRDAAAPGTFFDTAGLG